MDLYDSNVQKVMGYLKTESYSEGIFSGHRVFYKELGEFLVKKNLSYSSETAFAWVISKADDWNDRKNKYVPAYLQKLNDIYEFGKIKEEHRIGTRPVYGRLLPEFKEVITGFLEYCQGTYSIGHLPNIKGRCARFFLFLQEHGVKEVSGITYELIMEFHKTDWYQTPFEQGMYEASIRSLLLYLYQKGMCTIGFSLLLNPLRFRKVLFLSSLSQEDAEKIQGLKEESLDFPSSEFWDAAQDFRYIVISYGYSNTMQNSCDCTLTLLFLFLDIHGLGYHPGIADIWFQNASYLFGTNWTMSRRVLKLFEQYTQEGDITPQHNFTYKPLAFDSIPEWCKPILYEFLDQKKREGKAASTICMYRSANTRFCIFLSNKGLTSFTELTPGLLKEFNLTDPHQTVEGKNAYNVRLRNFLFFLTDRRIIPPILLHGALPCYSAPKEHVVVALTDEEVQGIRRFKDNDTTALGLRKTAMLLLGLRMGLRGSDIVNLRFKDIDWKDSTLRIMQIKTKVELVLPIPVEAGNAVYRYLTEGRPESKSLYIFINHKAPYDRITRSVCRLALESALPERNIPGSGFHVTRRTFSTAMLRRGKKVSVISESLGHRHDSTVYKYLSLDEERMRSCPLSLSETGLSLNGGVSHV